MSENADGAYECLPEVNEGGSGGSPVVWIVVMKVNVA